MTSHLLLPVEKKKIEGEGKKVKGKEGWKEEVVLSCLCPKIRYYILIHPLPLFVCGLGFDLEVVETSLLGVLTTSFKTAILEKADCAFLFESIFWRP